MRKSLLSILLALVLVPCAAMAESCVSIAQLRTQVPARWQTTLQGPSGPVTVDAPVTLPDRETLPALAIRQGNMTVTIPEGAVDYWRVLHEPNTFCFSIGYDRKFPSAGRDSVGSIPWDEDTPQDNDFPADRALAIAVDAFRAAGGLEPGVDYVITQPEATSAYYYFDFNSGLLVKDRGPVTDEGFDRGAWYFKFPMPIHGDMIIEAPSHFFWMEAKGKQDPPTWYNPPLIARVVDDDHWEVVCYGQIVEDAVLIEDTPLADWARIQEAVAGLVADGTLRSVNSLELCALGCYLTPDASKEVQWALPFWRVQGLWVDDLGNEFPDTMLFIRAQTAEAEDPLDRRTERSRLQQLITWEDVQP